MSNMRDDQSQKKKKKLILNCSENNNKSYLKPEQICDANYEKRKTKFSQIFQILCMEGVTKKSVLFDHFSFKYLQKYPNMKSNKNYDS